MAFPAIIAALAASGIASQALKKKGGGVQAFDTGNLRNTILSGSKRQTDIASSLTPKLGEQTQAFETGIGEKLSGLEAGRDKLKSQFLQDIGERQDAVGSKLFDTLRGRILRGVPEAESRLKETLAATGGLQRGTAQEQLAAPMLQAQQDIGRAAEDIALQQQQQQIAATEKLFNLDEGFLKDKFGIEKQVLATAMASGREDLIREAQTLIDIADQETADLLEVEKFGLTGGMAERSAARREQGQRDAATIGAGSQLLGSLLPLLMQQGGGAQDKPRA